MDRSGVWSELWLQIGHFSPKSLLAADIDQEKPSWSFPQLSKGWSSQNDISQTHGIHDTCTFSSDVNSWAPPQSCWSERLRFKPRPLFNISCRKPWCQLKFKNSLCLLMINSDLFFKQWLKWTLTFSWWYISVGILSKSEGSFSPVNIPVLMASAVRNKEKIWALDIAGV